MIIIFGIWIRRITKMEFGLFEFSDQLNKYFRGELTKNELGMWGEKAFYDLLKGGYIENKKIVLYPFLKTVSKFHIEENDAEDHVVHPAKLSLLPQRPAGDGGGLCRASRVSPGADRARR